MDDLKRKFLKLYAVEGKTYPQIQKTLDVDRETVRRLYEQTTDERSYVGQRKATYKRKGYKKATFEEFLKKYEELKQKNQCCYCGISQAEITKLFAENLINTDRKGTRGRTLELERVEAKKPYEELSNIELACYWCNNAKSDEFSAEEFKPIGKLIGEALKIRLRQKQESSD